MLLLAALLAYLGIGLLVARACVMEGGKSAGDWLLLTAFWWVVIGYVIKSVRNGKATVRRTRRHR